MRGMGWSLQKPAQRALERDEAAISNWMRTDCPRMKKPAGRGAWLIFTDESGLLLMVPLCVPPTRDEVRQFFRLHPDANVDAARRWTSCVSWTASSMPPSR